MAAFARTELDLIGMARQDNQAAMTLFVIRDGKMIGRDVYLLDAAREATDDEVLASFLEQYYARATSIPREVYVPAVGRGRRRTIEAFLTERRGGPVHLRVPQRGEKRELMELATRNAAETPRPRAGALAGRPGQDARRAGGAGRRARPARRRRCASSATTSATSRAPSRSAAWSSSRTASRASGEYRRFRIRTVEGPNDFASHQEVLRRRFRVTKTGEEGTEEERRWAMPDLVIVDGGKGQVSAAKAVLDELGLHDLPLAGLAKEREELFLPGRSRADRPAGHLIGAVPRPAAARRGASLRHHLSPHAARQADGPLGLRRPARRRARSASASCSRCSARSSACARRRSSRSRRCPASAAPWPNGSRRPWRPSPAAADPAVRHAAPGGSVYHPAGMRRAGPILIVLIGVLALFIDFFPGLRLPDSSAADGHGAWSRRSSGWTSRAACGSSTRPCPRTASRRTPRAWASSRTSSSAA